jgi:glycosyltransferase involved in cell wall biosynthesis
MEAAASGLPIVATDIRGCREFVVDGRTGLLVPVRDVAALETAIDGLASHGQLRRRMGQAAAAKAVDKFDQRNVIARTLESYAGLNAMSRP